MNKDFENYLNKKNDLIQSNCSCGDESFVFVDLTIGKFLTVCRKCGKRVFHVMCDDAKCGSGFAIPENDKSIDLINKTWKCEICKKTNSWLPEIEVPNYYENELPPEVMKQYDSSSLFPKWTKWVFYLWVVGSIVYYFVYFIISKK